MSQMSRQGVLAAAVLATGIAAAPATAAFAAGTTTCDAYSHKCTTVEGKKITQPPAVAPQQATLPFTGAEILGMSAAGLVALGGGTVLIVAGRRRRRTPAAA